eukprot:CAMPEP_0184383802 /NCGR_PEP_ID=MMETSP0007-20130409/7430_1 /TAXON_ID=97485 /ORGANISM="Prymnesium parvum, Strain Texoma1" /LENGTH=61 /DNA_ID=CAMNT_0026730439 /DNA_START=49 /DNA_END=230 /DNA_ORIENTATION=-
MAAPPPAIPPPPPVTAVCTWAGDPHMPVAIPAGTFAPLNACVCRMSSTMIDAAVAAGAAAA